MDFGSPSSSSSGDVDKQIAAATQQYELQMVLSKIQKITDKCFQKCVQKPGSSLDSYQQKCLAFCMDRYGDAERLVAEGLKARAQMEGM